MLFFSHFLYGLLMGYGGLLAPGMLNMTAVRYAIDRGLKQGVIFSAGAALVVFIQAMIALFFADYLNKHPHILDNLTLAGVFVFFALAVFFFLQARKKFKGEGKRKKGSVFFTGVFMSSINMLAVPFYLAISAYLSSKDKLILEQPYIVIFIVGASLGAFLLFITYAYFASYITKKVQFIAKNINYILSILFLVLGIVTITKL
ncbi:MAG: LysE family transporter [Flavobacteriaceae bacterium]|nr:LysE family transporter [Flavobacteriaceae bacterium]MCB0485251.1 LysE family transporter [Flavobacteriaceae bacterium]